MVEGMRRQHPAARRAVHEPLLDEVGLDDLLDGVARLRQRRRDGFDADRTAAEIDGDGAEISVVHGIKTAAVDLELEQGAVGKIAIDQSRPGDGSEIAQSAHQAAGNARRAARAPRHLAGPVLAHFNAEHPAAAAHDREQLVIAVDFEPDLNAEAVAQRRGEETGAGGGADQGETGKLDADRPGGRAFADDQVELEVLHCRVEDLLDRGIEPMDLVDEEDVAFLEIGEERREIAGAGDHRAGGGAEIHPKLARHDLRERRLAEPRRAGEENVVEGLAAGAGGGDEDLEIGTRLGLADKVGEALRTQLPVGLVLAAGTAIDQAGHDAASSRKARRISRSAPASGPAAFTATLTAAPAWAWP